MTHTVHMLNRVLLLLEKKDVTVTPEENYAKSYFHILSYVQTAYFILPFVWWSEVDFQRFREMAVL